MRLRVCIGNERVSIPVSIIARTLLPILRPLVNLLPIGTLTLLVSTYLLNSVSRSSILLFTLNASQSPLPPCGGFGAGCTIGLPDPSSGVAPRLYNRLSHGQ